MAEVGPDRHLSRPSLQQYFAAGAPSLVVLDGTPTAYLVVDPEVPRLSLRVPRDSDALPDLHRYDALRAAELHWEGRHWYQLSIVGPAVHEAFPLLADVSDRIQLQGQSFGRAVTLALRSFRDLLAGVSVMSRHEEIGLVGELLVLEHLISMLPAQEGVAAWRGWDAAEHDFDLGDADLEVKTTLSERRQHRIASATQLVPTSGRELRLASLQITPASEHAPDAVDLTTLVRRIAGRIAEEEVQEDFFARLKRVRWTEATASLYTNRFRLRSRPAHYSVDEDFPSITPAKLETLGLGAEVMELTYMLDLSGLPESAVPHPLILEFGEYSVP
ncbi:PD-(D/E)XK motif protein [Hyphomonas sp.]|uniref:PD-(D/E)XK motif protein n=1 Tax=Hyphomonas sp. TaxID=87 RepID=UPI0032EE2171